MLLAVAGSLAVVAAGLWIGSSALGRPFVIRGESMAPTLRPGDRVLVRPLRGGEPRRGDLVAVRRPDGLSIKRVVGLEGDRVVEHRARWALLAPGHLASPDGSGGVARDLGPGELFLVGDHRARSRDSRTWGPVPREALAGRVTARLWPPGRIPRPPAGRAEPRGD